MPCPYFEPQRIAAAPQSSRARLPLIHEYDGLCCAHSEAFAAPSQMRFRYCNHGYSKGSCPNFPATDTRSAFRYASIRETSKTIELLCIEEQDYAPLRWHSVCYFFEEERLEPEIADACMRAQILAFCRSYLQRLPA